MPDDTLNPDRAQVRDFGRSNPWPATDADVHRLQDEVAFLVRDRDRWRETARQAEAAAKDTSEAWLRVREDRDSVRERLTRDRDFWRERALQAEADANVMALCMAVCDGRVFVQLNQPQRSMIAARLREAYDRADARKRGGGAA